MRQFRNRQRLPFYLSAVTGCAAVIGISMCAPSAVAQETAAEKTTYDDHVKAIFAQRCSSCHNPNKKSADLDVTNFSNLMQGGASGAVVEPGDPDFSRLFTLVNHDDEPKMPPDGKIPQAEIDLIKTWIDGGALENMGSKAVIKKKMGVAMAENPLERPQVIAMPPRLSLEPQTVTEKNDVVSSIATSPWGPLAAVAGERQVLLYHTQNLELVGVLPFPEGAVNVVRFSRTGQLLLAAGGQPGARGLVVLWDVTSGERIAVIGDEFDEVLAADISADHSQVALGGPQRTIKVYSTQSGELQFEMTKPTEWLTAIEFSPDGVLLATGDRNGGLYVWEATTGREYLTLNGHSGAITGLSWRADSNVLASASQDTTIRLWEMENGNQIKNWGAHGGGATAIEFARDGRILSTGRDRVTKLWDQNGQQLKAFAALPAIGLSVSWCDETSRAMAGDYSGQIVLWQESDAAQVGSWTPNPPSLEQRLAAATTALNEKSAGLPPLKQNLDQATAELTAMQSQLAETQQVQASTTQTVAALDAEIKTATTQKTESEQSLSQVTDQLTRHNAAKPLVSEAVRNIIEAAGQLTDNAAIGQQATVLTEQLKQIESQIAMLTSQQTEFNSKITELTTQLTQANEKLQKAQQELKTANEKVAAIQAQLPPIEQKHQEATAAYNNLNADVQAAQAQVDRWNEETNFAKQMVELRQKLEAAMQVVQQREQSLNEATTQLNNAQSAVDTAKQSVGEAQAGVDNILQKIAKAKGIDQ